MKAIYMTSAVLALIVSSLCVAEGDIQNPLIDAPRFLRMVEASHTQREKSRLSEKAFLKAMQSGEYILLDARSAANFSLRHVRNAVNLPFTEFTADALARVIPNKASKILIYCNNNFNGSPVAFESKAPAASLNLSTQVALRTYGYTHIFELGPLLDVTSSSLPFEGSEVEDARPLPRKADSGAARP